MQRTALQDDLRLLVVARDDVAHGPECWCLHQGRAVLQEVDEPLADASMDHRCDALVRAVREVRESPAGISQDLDITRVDELRERGQGRRHPLERRRWLPTAEVRECPAGVAHHGHLLRRAQHRHDWVQAAALQHEIAEVRRVARNVPQCPDGLLSHVVIWRSQQLHKNGQCAVLNDHSCLFGGARGDVCEHPGCLELQVWPGHLLKEVYEPRYDPDVDDLLDGGILLDAEQLPERLRGAEVLLRVV
mmetsp:Transcript_19637/g.57016  ORF Transcript_19637/g.57016 Transcript_19637/m.57016 type:complete len:247 (-) Transcript_19637:341-1081(-)